MIPQWMIFTILGLIIAAWFLIGEKKSLGEKIGTILFFAALYFIYQTLNTEQAADYVQNLKNMLGMH